MTIEHRKYPRRTLGHHRCFIIIGVHTAKCAGQVENISRNGMAVSIQLHGREAFVGQRIQVFMVNSVCSIMRGTVRRYNGNTLGIKFDSLDCGKESWRKLCAHRS